METRFARWLKKRGLTPWRFARERGYYLRSVRRLAGIGQPGERIGAWRNEFLLAISGETGIPVPTLRNEAERAMQNPTPPRAYRWRKTAETTEDGKAAE